MLGQIEEVELEEEATEAESEEGTTEVTEAEATEAESSSESGGTVHSVAHHTNKAEVTLTPLGLDTVLYRDGQFISLSNTDTTEIDTTEQTETQEQQQEYEEPGIEDIVINLQVVKVPPKTVYKANEELDMSGGYVRDTMIIKKTAYLVVLKVL